MPEGAVYVGRPTKWGNTFLVSEGRTAQKCVDLFRQWIYQIMTQADIEELRGKDLACWCPLDQPCHADVLLELANKQDN